MKNNTTSLSKIEQNFRELIIEQCRFCKFDKYLERDPDFEFPKITEDLLEPYTQNFVAIPGMFGGFTYYLDENMNGKLMLRVEQSSRMDHSSDDYMYFEITKKRSRMLEGEERDDAQDSFRKLAKGVRRKRLQELKAMKENEKVV